MVKIAQWALTIVMADEMNNTHLSLFLWVVILEIQEKSRNKECSFLSFMTQAPLISPLQLKETFAEMTRHSKWVPISHFVAKC